MREGRRKRGRGGGEWRREGGEGGEGREGRPALGHVYMVF